MNDNNDDQPSREDDGEFAKVIRGGFRRPLPGADPDASKWEQFKAMIAELAEDSWEQARDWYSPKWPPTWLRVSAVTAVLVVFAFVLVPIGAWAIGLAGDGIGWAAGEGWSWAAAWELTDVVTHPVHSYINAHAPALGLAPSLVFWIWAGAAITTFVLGLARTVAGTVGWVLVGAATVAMVWAETPASGRGIAVGITAAWWIVLSLAALGHRTILVPVSKKDLDKLDNDDPPVREFVAQLAGAPARFDFAARHHRVKNTADALDALADSLTAPDDRDDDAVIGEEDRSRRGMLAKKVRDVRMDLIGVRAYPPVPVAHDRYSGGWHKAFAPVIRTDHDDQPVPERVYEALLDGFAAGQAADLIRNLERTSAPAGDRRVLADEELGRVAAWLWSHDPEAVASLAHDIYAPARSRFGGEKAATIAEFTHDLDALLPRHFGDRRALIGKVRDILTLNFPH